MHVDKLEYFLYKRFCKMVANQFVVQLGLVHIILETKRARML